MTKTAPMARVRQNNLYTIERDGQPVAQAMAISQAEAVALWIASQQQPVLSARLSTPIEARTLAGLPLLSRDAPAVPAPGLPPERDPRVPDMFEDEPTSPVSPVVGAVVDAEWDPVASIPRMEAVIETMERLSADHVEDLRAMVPEVADAQPGEPADCIDAAPTAGESDGVYSAVADEPTHAERMASAYEAGVELGKQGKHRWGADFLDADATLTDGLTSGKQIDEIGAELRRGFEFGQAPELKRQAEQAAARRASGGKPVAMYRNPVDGASWSGRGLRPRWLVEALEAGHTQEEFLIDPNGAQA